MPAGIRMPPNSSFSEFDRLRRYTYADALERPMAKLALVYGLRLFPADELEEVKNAPAVLRGGRTAQVTMHLIEGSK